MAWRFKSSRAHYFLGKSIFMKPQRIDHINDELAIIWDDGVESYLNLQALRKACPCAACAGERDLMGNVYKAPPSAETPAKYQLKKFNVIGGYAIQLFWGDNHDSGLFSFQYLRGLTE